MAEHQLVFMFDGKPVGYFEESEYPRFAGTYRYMPFRGPGHYKMHEALNSSLRAQCYYQIGQEVTRFTVTNCPEKGVLELNDFQQSSEEGE